VCAILWLEPSSHNRAVKEGQAKFGLGDKFKALFDEVQRSNMSKACSSREEAEATVAHYQNTRGDESYIVEADGRFLVYRKSDDKTLKSVNYSPAELEGILKG
jgi:hypothetical protein